jgi:citronellol/citronellal dehydrogenase
MPELKGKTIIITGASRGIGRAMAVKFARDGANLVVASKTAEPHPKLKGTIYDAAEEIEAAGGRALPFQVDIRFENQVDAMVQAALDRFGGIDVLVNNAGAISLSGVEKTPPNRYDLMQAVNARAVFILSRAVLPFLKKSANPHILTLSPPINLDLKWFKDHAPYTLSKYGMTMLSLGMSTEFKPYGISVNCLWPRTIIATAAIEFAVGSRELFKNCRKPDIMADAAYAVITTEKCALTGQCLIDEEVLKESGVSEFSRYAVEPGNQNDLIPDLYL